MNFGDDFIRETRLFASNRKMAGIGNCCIYDVNAIHCCTMNYTECYNYSTNGKIENTGYSFDSYNFTCPYEWDSSGIGYVRFIEIIDLLKNLGKIGMAFGFSSFFLYSSLQLHPLVAW